LDFLSLAEEFWALWGGNEKEKKGKKKKGRGKKKK